MPVKARLLDQRSISGVGNLLADETLWRARLSPRRPAGELTTDELDHLRRVLRAATRDAIRKGGVHTGDFITHRKRGAPCPRCGPRSNVRPSADVRRSGAPTVSSERSAPIIGSMTDRGRAAQQLTEYLVRARRVRGGAGSGADGPGPGRGDVRGRGRCGRARRVGGGVAGLPRKRVAPGGLGRVRRVRARRWASCRVCTRPSTAAGSRWRGQASRSASRRRRCCAGWRRCSPRPSGRSSSCTRSAAAKGCWNGSRRSSARSSSAPTSTRCWRRSSTGRASSSAATSSRCDCSTTACSGSRPPRAWMRGRADGWPEGHSPGRSRPSSACTRTPRTRSSPPKGCRA